MGPLAVLLPVIALVAAILPSSAMAALSGSSVSGVVLSSYTFEPLSGVTVTAIDTTTSGNGGQTTITDSNGGYELTGLTGGDDYYLSFSSHGSTSYYDETAGNDVTSSQSDAMTDASSDTALDTGHANNAFFTIAGLNNTSIGGSVYDPSTNHAISGVTVTAIDATTSANGGQTATTDGSGQYTLPGLTSGDSYYLAFAYSGYLTQYYDEDAYDYLTPDASRAASDALDGDDSQLNYGYPYGTYLQSGGALSGTLSFPSGTSPNGQVRVVTADGGQSYYGNVGSDGSYSVLGVPAGSSYVVEYQPSTTTVDQVWYGGSSGTPSFSASLAAAVSVTSGQLTTGVNFSVPATATVTGTVSGPGGAIGSAAVGIYDLSGNYAGQATTNSAGQFTLDDRLDPGAYYLEAEDFSTTDNLAPGYSGVFTVSAGGTVTENIAMGAGGTVTGTVSGPTGSELTDSQVYVTAVNGTYSTGASVNSSGTYTLHGIPAGNYYLEWEPADSSYPYVWYDGSSLVSLEQDAQVITVSAGGTVTANFSNIPQAAEIQGTVTDAALNQPVRGVYVELLDSRGNYVDEGETSVDGGYAITGLLPGSYKVEFVPESQATVAGDPAPELAFQYYADASSFATASTVTVAAGQTAGGINAALGAGGTVSGRVTDAATGAGLPDMYVELLTSTGQDVDSGYTNDDGTYTIYGVAPGSYYVEFDSTQIGASETVAQFYGGKSTLEGATMVTVSAGQAVQNISASVGLLTAAAAAAASPAAPATPATPATPAKPVVSVPSHSGLVKGNRLGVRLRCSGAACIGSVKVSTNEVVYVKHGKKRVRKHRTVVIGTAHYSASAGQTKTLMVRLNGAGKRALSKAKGHRLSVVITAAVSGGKNASRHEKIWTATKHKQK